MTSPAATAASAAPAAAPAPAPAPAHDFTASSLRTARLILRPWGEADIDARTEACQDPDILRYVPYPSPYTRAHAETFVRETSPAARAAGTSVVFGVFEAASGRAVAEIGLHRIKDLGAEYGGVADLGYWSAPAARGHGFVTEAAREVCRWGFGELGLARIQWTAIVGNEASWRVAQKLGFTREGTLRSSLVQRGQRTDGWIGSLLREEGSFDQP